MLVEAVRLPSKRASWARAATEADRPSDRAMARYRVSCFAAESNLSLSAPAECRLANARRYVKAPSAVARSKACRSAASPAAAARLARARGQSRPRKAGLTDLPEAA